MSPASRPKRRKRIESDVWRQLLEVSKEMGKYAMTGDDHQWAARQVESMVEAWQFMYDNGVRWETPEETLKYDQALVVAGAAIVKLAELFLDES